MKQISRMQGKKKNAAADLLRNSSILNVKRFTKKADELKKFCIENKIFEKVTENGKEMPFPFAVFFSVGSPKKRAVVRVGKGESIEEAWNAAAEKMVWFLKNNDFEVRFVKADMVDQGQWFPLEMVNDILANATKNFWRCGIAFDENFNNVFLEEEQNALRLVRYDVNGISLQRINKHLLDNNHKQMFRLPDNVLVFSCQAVFSDSDDKVYALYDEGYGYGRRKIEAVDKPLLKGILSTAGEQLSNMMEGDGKFKYGFFADMNERIPTYNVIRHTVAVWALIMKYTLEPSKALKEKIDLSIKYLIDTFVEEKDDKAFVIERNANEVKLGANAVSIVMLITYMEVMGVETYIPLIKKLGEGILSLQGEEGDFWHILSYPDYNRKEKFRIVYYDGESTFALAKLYGVTKEEKWLNAAKKSVEYFIEKDYTKYSDHWVSYSLNEITKYVPDERYFNFNLRNIENNIEEIYKQDTSFHTYLEMLMLSFLTYERMKKAYPDSAVLKAFDEKELVRVIYYRAQHMLSGYLYPEYAMYFKYPEPFIGSFCVRHHNYRVRIDDIQHFMGGYYQMLQNFETLEALREKLGITPDMYILTPEEEEEENG